MSYLERLVGTGCPCEGLPERFAHLSAPIGYVVGSFLNVPKMTEECAGYCDDAHFGKVCGLAQHIRGTRGKREKSNKKRTRRREP